MQEKPQEFYQQLMMKQIDGEITPEEARQLAQFLEANPSYRKELETMSDLKMETEKMKGNLVPDLAWDDYWRQLYNRLERGISWILISLGAMIVLSYGIYHAVMELWQDSTLPLILKYGTLALIIGAAILLVSVAREKLLLRKHDRYKEIER